MAWLVNLFLVQNGKECTTIVARFRDSKWRNSQQGTTLCPESDDGGSYHAQSELNNGHLICDKSGYQAARFRVADRRRVSGRPLNSVPFVASISVLVPPTGLPTSPCLLSSSVGSHGRRGPFLCQFVWLFIDRIVCAGAAPSTAILVPPPRRPILPSAFYIFLSQLISCFSSFLLKI